MKQLHNFLREHDIKTKRYEKKGKVYIIEVEGKKYAIKKKEKDKKEIYDYLEARSFPYYPAIINSLEEEYEVTPHIKDRVYPSEQKMMDMIHVVALLHSKTTFYKEIDKDYFSKIYEEISGNIAYLEGYYKDRITMIEKEVYMSPSSYFLARNISVIFDSLEKAKEFNEKWFSIAEKKNKARFVVLHNNLKLDHFLKEEQPYLVSWDKAKVDIPIFDLYKLYKNHALDFDFEMLFREYEKKYPLLEEERILFFTLILLPDKLDFEEEMETCKTFTKEIDVIYKTRNFIFSYEEKKE